MVKQGTVVRLSDKGWEYLSGSVSGDRQDLWVVCEGARLDTTPVLCRRLIEPDHGYLLYLEEFEEVEPCDTARET